MLITVSVSKAIRERSFSKLTLILTSLRALMNQSRLNLTLLRIEKTLHSINFTNTSDDFAGVRARRVDI